MARPALVLFSCIVTFSLSLLPCASLSQDGVILLKMKKEYCSDTEALNDWNESDQNPCAWSRISCDTFNCVTKVNLSGSFISGNLTSALCSLPNLTTLILSYNEFGGPFPDGLLHCKSLRQLDLSSNQFLDLKSNKFSGTLPISIYELSDLRELYLAGNSFIGHFPHGLLHCKRLEHLDLSENLLIGRLPSRISELSELRELNLAYNDFSGSIPPAFGMLPKLEVLEWDIQCSREYEVSGEIPDFFGRLTQLEWLDMRYNHLRGNIPTSLMQLSTLGELLLDQNNLSGRIPANIHQLRSLTILGLSDNDLSGRIPSELQWDSLTYFSLSNNNLSGHIPEVLDKQAYKDNLLPNPRLCGGRILTLPPCSTPYKLSPERLATILVVPLFIVAVALSSICLCRSSRRKPTDTPSWKMTPFISTEVNGSYILRNLKESNVIGSGGSGNVYKVILQNGQAVAVKKIRNRGKLAGNLMRNGEHEENKIGEVEVDILGLIRHTNILKLLCYISSEEFDFKLLVYQFMPNGSLFDCMHGDPEPQMALQWPMRYQIALGAARGLSYMHHNCSPPVLHRDVKSSNILLDEDFRAKMADFGVSRVFDRLGDEHTVSGYVGSHGYIAPEYGHILKVSEKSDVYSFGVLLRP
ncbi:hypothetical protein SUGI_1083840 [Cryptomeria japonica]|nr:hypothetical protein SUGI_1083840 [Cryptomeria japonica]